MSKFSVAFLIVLAPVLASVGCEAATTQAQINASQGQLRVQAEENLSHAITEYKARLSPEQIELFNHSQSAWASYRDTACTFQTSGTAGSSIHPTAMAVCLTAKTKERLIEIKALATCQEGDTSCPVW